MNGILFVDKPKGITSHDVVDIVRGQLGIRRVGHGGTLDPLATGLMLILVGKSTKLFPKLSGLDKEYFATMKLGTVTSTGDSEGKILKESGYDNITELEIRDVFSKFIGELLQVPPQVSALRYKGRRLYDLARQGKTVSLPPRRIKIHSLIIKNISLPYIDFEAFCSKGTYIRKLAEDIGNVLGCGAHITKIRRTKIGPFKVEDSINPYKVDESYLIRDIPRLEVQA